MRGVGFVSPPGQDVRLEVRQVFGQGLLFPRGQGIGTRIYQPFSPPLGLDLERPGDAFGFGLVAADNLLFRAVKPHPCRIPLAATLEYACHCVTCLSAGVSPAPALV
ncbi:MAG: hypothetical protein WCI73_16450, partial [Phycisphaerae bacterium]